MAGENFSDQLESVLQPSSDQKMAACQASERLRQNVAGIAKDNGDVNREMNNGRVQCDPPPITPRCHWEDIPPNPAIVSNRVNDMISRGQAMHGDLSQLSSVVANNPQLSKELDEVNNRLLAVEFETSKLYDMTSGGMYDEGAIDKENRVIGKLIKPLDKSLKTLMSDLGCEGKDSSVDTLAAPEHETVSCDVAMSPKKVWKLIGKFDALRWHPGIESGTVSEDGNVRKLIAQGGTPTFTEQLIAQGRDRKTGEGYYTYKMAEGLPIQPISTLRVEPNGKGSRITWTADMNLSDLDDKTADAVGNGIKHFYQQGLSALLEQLNKK